MSAGPLTIGALNQLDRASFTALLGGVFEHSPWVPETVWDQRPFADLQALHAAMVGVVNTADADRRTALLCAHPELAVRGSLTAESASEQRGIGLDSLTAEEAAEITGKNRLYRERFGIPFIIAVRGQKDRTAILAALTRRLASDVTAEHEIALAEVAKIARFRLEDLATDNSPAGWISVHALDTATGRPAAGLSFTLARLDGGTQVPLGRWVANADGRCDAPLLAGDALLPGLYEIMFEVGAWQTGDGFYDTIPIRFLVRDPSVHYHIPLLLAPFGYSTYRGS